MVPFCGLALAPCGAGCRGGHRARTLAPLFMVIWTMLTLVKHKISHSSIRKSNPNPDIEKVHVAGHRDLERFFKRGICDFSNCLPIPYQERMAPVAHGHSLAFGQTTPLALSLVRCIRLLFTHLDWRSAQKTFF